jgi:uncharacterized protein YciI
MEHLMALFAANLEFTSDLEHRDQIRPHHREYLRSLLDAGKLHESGPYADNSGALIVYEATDLADVQELVANDPYAKAGIIKGATILEWNVVISKYA